MAIIKRFNLKGLATKIDDLYKKQEMATDCLNVTKNYSGRIEGRKGVLKIADVSCSDMYYSREKQKHYKFTTTMQESADGVTFSDISVPFNPATITSSKKSITEISGDVFFSDTTLVDPVMKFNGYEMHQAGCPELTSSDITVSTGSTSSLSGSFKVGFSVRHVGVNGDQYNGPLYEVPLSLSNTLPVVSAISSIGTINSSRGTKYYDRYFNEPSGFTISNGVITPANTFATNFIAGDYIKIVKKSTSRFLDSTYEKIESVSVAGGKNIITLVNKTINSATHFVCFDSSEKVTASRAGCTFNSHQKYVLDVFMTGTDDIYRYCGYYDYTSGNIYFSFPTTSTTLNNLPLVDDYINVDDSRVQPPKCKYLASFGDMLYCMNVKDVDQDNVSAQTLSYSLFFSAYGEGCSPETFNYSNNIVIGTPDEGTIIGAGVVGNNIAILKDRATHIITMNQYGDIGRIVKASATVGCASNKAILNFDNSLAWLSDKGIFSLSKTGEPEELTEEIENIFTDNPYSLDFSNSRVAIDRFNETILFYCPHTTTRANDVTIVFSYKWKEWYLWKGLNALDGFYHTGDTFFFNDGTKSYKINKSSMNDNISGSDVAVERYYSSGWEHLGEPANEKKFNNLVVFSVKNPEYSYESWNCQVKSDYDWDTSNEAPIDSVKSFSTSTRRNFVNCDKTSCYSRRFTFYNNTLNQGFSLSGYEFEVIQTQQRMRD